MTEFSFIPFESFNGAVARWGAELGGAERLRDLTAFAGVQYGHRQDAASASPDQIRALAAEMNVDPAELLIRAMPRLGDGAPNRGMRHMFFGMPIPVHLIEKRVRRYSPAALAASRHDRAIWHIRLFPFCPETWEILVTGCQNPDCNGRPAWQRTLGIERCEHCGGDLTKAATTVVPEGHRERLRAAIGIVDPDPDRRAATLATLPPTLASARPEFVIELLQKVMAVADPGLPTDVVQMCRAPAEQLCRAISRSWGILSDWPDALTALASERIATSGKRHGDGNGGRTNRFISPTSNTDTSPTVAAMIAGWRETIDLNGPNRARLLERTRTITEAGSQLGLGTSILADLRRQSVFRPSIVLDGCRLQPRFDTIEIDELAALMESRLPIDRARRVLGVSCHGVEQLVAMRLVEQEMNRFIKARYEFMQIVASSIGTLESRVEFNATGDADLCTLPLDHAMKAIGGRLKPWGSAFRALLDGQIGYVLADGDAPLSRRILIDPASLEKVAALSFDARDPAFLQILYARVMSKTDARETLNLGFTQSTSLLRTVWTGAGTRTPHMTIDHVKRLAVAHISSTELAIRRGVTTQRAYRDATRDGLPDLGSGGFCRLAAEQRYFPSSENTRNAFLRGNPS